MPHTQRAGIRRERAAAVDSILLDAALAEIRVSGPDELNLSSVARRADVTTGAVYSRYENANELVLDTWNSRCAGPLRAFILQAVSMARGDKDATTSVRADLRARPVAISAAIAVLIASPRIAELEETLVPEFGGWLRDLRIKDTLTDDVLVPVAYALGAACFDAMVDAPNRDWASPLSWITAVPSPSASHESVAVTAVSDLAEIPFVIFTGNATRDALLTGAVSVIARSGLRHSSTSRIARASGHTQSALFQTWKTRSELVSDVTGFISEGFAAAARPFGSAALAGDATAAAEGIARLLSPASHMQRRVRLEFTLAAMRDRDVADRVHAADQAAVDALMEVAPHAVLLVESIRAVVLGLILLEESMGGLTSVDFAPLIQPLLDRARG